MISNIERDGLLGAITKLSRALIRYTANNKDHVSRIDALRECLLKNNDISLNELAHTLDVRPPSVSEWIEKLSENEELIKTRDEADKRVIRYSLTPKGQEIAKEAEAKISQAVNIFDDCLSEDDEKAFIALCDKLYDHLHDKIEAMNDPLDPDSARYRHDRHRAFVFGGRKPRGHRH